MEKPMVLWKLKKCPRCHGDLFLDNDLDGWYEQCLQCGYRRGMKALAEFKPMAEDEGPTPVEVRAKRNRTDAGDEASGVPRRTPRRGAERDN